MLAFLPAQVGVFFQAQLRLPGLLPADAVVSSVKPASCQAVVAGTVNVSDDSAGRAVTQDDQQLAPVSVYPILRQVRDAPRPRFRPGAAWDVVAFKFGGVPHHRVFSRVPNLLNRCGL